MNTLEHVDDWRAVLFSIANEIEALHNTHANTSGYYLLPSAMSDIRSAARWLNIFEAEQQGLV